MCNEQIEFITSVTEEELMETEVYGWLMNDLLKACAFKACAFPVNEY